MGRGAAQLRGRGCAPGDCREPGGAGLPESEYKRPRLLAGPQGCAPREQGPELSVDRRSLAQLQPLEPG
ncbi:C-type lectin domain family 4 member G [Phyllostomus discolor]|uniref:C-type lectin domain family 4 member G n=1 Tax=Phyllostomus discolor TaxID=89673 RepID=A0A834DK89_9CHIR|nr:C-type lectin domain family 4 member G [Phyllostomus discolor]